MKKNLKGFTIVELLIVIVVIAILAAISIVAYTGVTNRANDTTVQNDLASLQKKIELFFVDHGNYPHSGTIGQLGFRASKNSYMTDESRTTFNLNYCHNGTTAIALTSYAVVAMSASGNAFIIRNGTSVAPLNAWTVDTHPRDFCEEVLPSTVNNYNGWLATDTETGPWRAWTGI